MMKNAPANDCFRLIPKLSYVWEPTDNRFAIEKFTSFYKLDYGDSGGARGLATFGGTTPGFIPPELFEVRFNAVTNGKAGEIDNIHDMHIHQGLFVPGCRPTEFDCFHMHWRWNPTIADVLIDPETDFKINASFSSHSLFGTGPND